MKSKVYSVSDEEFKVIVKESQSYSECLRKLGLKTRGGSSTDTLKRRIQELNCSIEHFNPYTSFVANKMPLHDILIENSTYANTASLKKRLLNEKVLEYKCAICGISDWQGQPLSLQLDHVNGVNTDNRIENLRLLCPNCHSQTNTYAGLNKGKDNLLKLETKPVKDICPICGVNEKLISSSMCAECYHKQERVVDRPTREELKDLIRVIPFTRIADKFGVTDNAIRKWCDSYNLPRRVSDIKQYSDEEWSKI